MQANTQTITKQDIPQLQEMANNLRYLCADIVERANSGHPGTPMGLAEVATTLSYHLRLNPKNPQWLNRDRLIFSGGHASALLYSLLHLWGFELSMDDLKSFRQLESKTPGHPEYPLTPGVEISTGPLGQGIANAVGFALAAKKAQNLLGADDKGAALIDHNVYCICGDGDLQEGISYEAASVAGVSGLDNLIIIYDSNGITIEGDVKIAFGENVKARFEAQGFSVFECDGHDFLSINTALESAKKSHKPSLIIASTIIGKGAPSLEGSHKTHGAPIGESIIAQGKKEAGLPESSFSVSERARFAFGALMERGASEEALWQNCLTKSAKEMIARLQNPNIDEINYPNFGNGDEGKSIATRASNGEILNAIAAKLPGFVGGSADLAPSNNTHIKDSSDFPSGQNMHFGIREHSMGAICNGIANYGLFLPFCATFFVFSDYMAASVRVASIMCTKVFYVWTHDSIGVGEDGATHQPIEQLSHFRAMPNLLVFRPANANENILCWQVALRADAPCAFVLSRQNLPVLPLGKYENVAKGAYIVRESKLESKADVDSGNAITLIASGSEVSLALNVAKELESSGIFVRVVSAPCYDLLIKQDKSYIDSLFIGKVLGIEAARGLEWYRFCDEVVCMDSFGHSAKGDALFKHFGFGVDSVVKVAKALLAK